MSAGGRKIEKNVPQFRTTSKQSLFEVAFEGIFGCDAPDSFSANLQYYVQKKMDWNNTVRKSKRDFGTM